MYEYYFRQRNYYMNITLEQEKNHWIMEIHFEGIILGNAVGNWDSQIDSANVELSNRQGVQRKAYNTWHWDGRREQEAREYITYFYLKNS
jgi:hypothetical protein